jgi:hypothetical protein
MLMDARPKVKMQNACNFAHGKLLSIDFFLNRHSERICCHSERSEESPPCHSKQSEESLLCFGIFMNLFPSYSV